MSAKIPKSTKKRKGKRKKKKNNIADQWAAKTNESQNMFKLKKQDSTLKRLQKQHKVSAEKDHLKEIKQTDEEKSNASHARAVGKATVDTSFLEDKEEEKRLAEVNRLKLEAQKHKEEKEREQRRLRQIQEQKELEKKLAEERKLAEIEANKPIVPKKKERTALKDHIDYVEDVYIDGSWLKAAAKADNSRGGLTEFLEPFKRAKFIVFELHSMEEPVAEFSAILGALSDLTTEVEGLYFFHVATHLSDSAGFIHHMRDFIAHNSHNLRELVFNCVGHTQNFFTRLPIMDKLQMVTFTCVDYNESVFDKLALLPELKHITIYGGSHNDFLSEEYMENWLKKVGSNLQTIGFEFPHVHSTPEFWDFVLPCLPNVKVVGIRDWEDFSINHIKECKYKDRLLPPSFKASKMGIPSEYQWWTHINNWRKITMKQSK